MSDRGGSHFHDIGQLYRVSMLPIFNQMVKYELRQIHAGSKGSAGKHNHDSPSGSPTAVPAAVRAVL